MPDSIPGYPPGNSSIAAHKKQTNPQAVNPAARLSAISTLLDQDCAVCRSQLTKDELAMIHKSIDLLELTLRQELAEEEENYRLLKRDNLYSILTLLM